MTGLRPIKLRVFMARWQGITGKMNEKILTVVICLIGVLAVAYGMIRRNNIVFVVGLGFVIGGYLRIRKKLKESLKKNE
jgi:uncharacterized membrane protein YidH (DUF202 family)